MLTDSDKYPSLWDFHNECAFKMLYFYLELGMPWTLYVVLFVYGDGGSRREIDEGVGVWSSLLVMSFVTKMNTSELNSQPDTVHLRHS